jgi:isopentenyl-diphosphate delta-isomerase
LECVVLLDERGEPVGSAPKRDVHHADTPLHLGFSCYVLDADDRLLVTRRATSKQTFPGVWTNSFCGHPLPAEPLAAAVRRRASHELGLEVGPVTVVLPDFRYRAETGGVVELELCPVTTVRVEADVPLAPLAGEVEEWEWVPWREFADEVVAGRRTVSPWCVEQVVRLADLGPPASWRGDARRLPPALRPPHVPARTSGVTAPDASTSSGRQPSTAPLPGALP